METITKQADLPFSCREIFNAVADFEKFPAIFPTIRDVEILSRGQDTADVKMDFSVPAAVASFLGGTSQTVRASLTPDSEIRFDTISGALKDMNISWTFNEISPGKTRVTFKMDYETGMNSVANATVKVFINRSAKDVLKNLEKHINKNKGP